MTVVCRDTGRAVRECHKQFLDTLGTLSTMLATRQKNCRDFAILVYFHKLCCRVDAVGTKEHFSPEDIVALEDLQEELLAFWEIAEKTNSKLVESPQFENT